MADMNIINDAHIAATTKLCKAQFFIKLVLSIFAVCAPPSGASRLTAPPSSGVDACGVLCMLVVVGVRGMV